MKKNTHQNTSKKNRRLVKFLIGNGVIILILAGILGFEVARYKYYEANYGPSYGELKEQEKEEPRIRQVFQEYDAYPKDLLELLSKNPDMTDFVLGYPQYNGQVLSDNVGEVKKGEIPLLLQYDRRWGYATYGNNCIAVNGCAPTALAMVYAGLTGDNMVTPYTIASWADQHGYYVPGSGTSWDMMYEGCENFGLTGKELSLSRTEVFRALENGHPVICSMGPGDFTSKGHFIVLVGVSDGKIRLNDPISPERSQKLWDFDVLSSQIRNLWSFSLS